MARTWILTGSPENYAATAGRGRTNEARVLLDRMAAHAAARA